MSLRAHGMVLSQASLEKKVFVAEKVGTDSAKVGWGHLCLVK